MKKSTIVHALTWYYRARLKAEALVDVERAADTAFRLFSSPMRHRRPAREHDVLARLEPHPYLIDGRPHWAWTVGEGPAVLLLHGWEGRGAQLSSLIEPLVARGYRVVVIDAPGHGDSPGSRATGYELALALRAVARTVPRVHAVVAHSLGGLATAFAVDQGLAVARVVVIGAPFSPANGIGILRRALVLDDEVTAGVRARLAAPSRFDWSGLEDGLVWGAVDVPLLVIHDDEDREVPLDEARRIVARARQATLSVTSGLGHRRILRDDDVVARVAAFVDEGPVEKRVWPWDNFLAHGAHV